MNYYILKIYYYLFINPIYIYIYIFVSECIIMSCRNRLTFIKLSIQKTIH